MSRGDTSLALARFLSHKDVGWQSYRAHCSNFCCWIPTESTNNSAFFGAAGGPLHSRTSVVCGSSLPQTTSVDTGYQQQLLSQALAVG